MKRALKKRTMVTAAELKANRAIMPELTGDVSGITGNVSGISGDVDGLSGYVSGLRGYVSGITGDVSGITGNVDDCELTQAERAEGVDITALGEEDSR